MKNYYWIELYQIKEGISSLSNDEIQFNIETTPNSLINTHINAPNYLENIQVIIVEKIFPYYVKEIRTGIIFPIVNIIDTVTSYNKKIKKLKYPPKKIHTFVFSKNNKLLGRKVKSEQEISWYNRQHLFKETYQKELKDIVLIGKTKVNNSVQNKEKRKILKRTIK